MTTLTMKRLRAIKEALCHRIAGPIKITNLDPVDYEQAINWAEGEIEKRKALLVERAKARASAPPSQLKRGAAHWKRAATSTRARQAGDGDHSTETSREPDA